MEVLKVPLFRSYWEKDDLDAVSSKIASGVSWADGPDSKEFEKLLASFIGVKHAVVMNSGTSALHSALLALGITGGEVIVPSFSFIATANAALFVGAKPVFADISHDFGLDPDDVAEKITPKTRAIIPVHYGGMPCSIDAIIDIAGGKGLPVIEDGCESFGAALSGKMSCSFGAANVTSFCQNKIISTGEGGAVFTDSDDVAERLRLLVSHGRRAGRYVSLGYNFRLSEIQSAMGISQMSKMNKIISLRQSAYEYMSSRIRSFVEVPAIPSGRTHVHQLFTILCASRDERDSLLAHLSACGISSKVYFDPIHLSEYYRSLGYSVSLPVTEDMSSRVLSLPLYPSMTKEDMDAVCSAVESYYGD